LKEEGNNMSNDKGPKVRFIEIEVVFDTEDEFQKTLERIREVLPPNFSKLSWDSWLNKPNNWKGYNNE